MKPTTAALAGFFAAPNASKPFCISLNDVLTMRLVNPQQRGFSSSILNMAWAAGWAITATLSGYVQTSYGFTPLLILGALAYVLSGLAIWKFERDDSVSERHTAV